LSHQEEYILLPALLLVFLKNDQLKAQLQRCAPSEHRFLLA